MVLDAFGCEHFVLVPVVWSSTHKLEGVGVDGLAPLCRRNEGSHPSHAVAPGLCASPRGPVLASAFLVYVFGLRTHYICGKNVFATHRVWDLSRLSEPINAEYPCTTVQGSRTLREPRVDTSLGVMSKQLLRSLEWGDGEMA